MTNFSLILLIIPVILLALVLVLVLYLIHVGFRENKVDWGSSTINCFDGLIRIYCTKFQRLKYQPLNLPKAGGVLVVCNHISGLDPLILQTACERPLRFMIAAEEYNRPILNRLFKAIGCIPVERTGRPEIAFRNAVSLLKSGEAIALYPHGGMLTDSAPYKPIKRGVFKLAELTGSSIQPSRLTGVRNEGSSFTPLFLRGHVELKVFKALDTEFIHRDDARKQLGDLLLGKITSINK